MATSYTINNIDYNIDCSGVYIWQYDEAVRFHKLLKGTEDFLKKSVTEFWEEFRDHIFNIAQAKTFGLELWGRELGIPRPTYDDNGVIKPISDTLYRRLLLGTLYKMNTNATVPNINHYISFILPDLVFFVKNGYDMTMTVLALNNPSDEEKAVLEMPGFIPVPAGVLCNFAYTTGKLFGFDFTGGTYHGFTNVTPALNGGTFAGGTLSDGMVVGGTVTGGRFIF